MNSSLSELTLPELTSSEPASPELAWSELPFPELPAYEFGYPEFNPMSSSLSKPRLPKFASPMVVLYPPVSTQDADEWIYLARWEAAIWECIPYTNIPRLLPELTDRIISFVGDNPNFRIKQGMLCSCALVCRTWLPASLYQLSNQDLLNIDTHFFKALVRASRTPSYSYAATLRVVRAIILSDAEPSWVYQFPLTLGRMFSAVQELSIEFLRWGKVVIHPRTLLVSFGQFGCVTNMELIGCRFRNFCQFWRLICALPRLQTLRVVDSALERCKPFPIAHLASRFPTFTCLVVQRGRNLNKAPEPLCLALLEWLTLIPASIHRLQRLYIFVDTILSPLRNFLVHAGTSLEDLELEFVYDTSTPSNVQDLNIGHCTALRNLDLLQVHGISLAEILRIISPNCHLHKLDIFMIPGEVDCEWESAARILDEPQFLTLREFRLDVREIVEEGKRRISDCFDALRRRGVDFRLFFDQYPYHGDSPTISAGQSKTPELQVEDEQSSGVPLTSSDDGHQSSV